ncbi:MAG: hypothetical protein ACTHLA_03235 [Asticcacaulis sp.]|uniref:hypothetical protein n=1 Tax=Asticcacaulis sp. TaxID=1872648 RepID=UPI003F7C2F19
MDFVALLYFWIIGVVAFEVRKLRKSVLPFGSYVIFSAVLPLTYLSSVPFIARLSETLGYVGWLIGLFTYCVVATPIALTLAFIYERYRVARLGANVGIF